MRAQSWSESRKESVCSHLMPDVFTVDTNHRHLWLCGSSMREIGGMLWRGVQVCCCVVMSYVWFCVCTISGVFLLVTKSTMFVPRLARVSLAIWWIIILLLCWAWPSWTLYLGLVQLAVSALASRSLRASILSGTALWALGTLRQQVATVVLGTWKLYLNSKEEGVDM